MKVIYIVAEIFLNEPSNVNVGVKKKIIMQLNSFKKRGYDTILISYSKVGGVCIFDIKNKSYNVEYFTYLENVFKYIMDYIKTAGECYVYVRNPFLYKVSIFNFIKQLCLENKVVYEFPTLPYDNEIKYDEGGRLLKIDRYYRERLSEFVKLSTNYNNLNVTFGIPSIPLLNAVDVSKIKVKEKFNKNNVINLTSVSSLIFWHGYDRIIEGMNLYYKSDNIKYIINFNIVGYGKEFNRLKKLTEKYKLEKYIWFYGSVYEEKKLNEIFQETDIAIGSLGIHRLGLENVSPIKTAEYCAMGLPIVIAYKDNAIRENCSFVLKVSGNETAINMNQIIDFYEKNSSKQVSKKIRKYAEENLTWDVMIDKILTGFANI